MRPSVNLSFSFHQNLFRAQGSLAASTSRQALRSSRASHRSQITKASSPTEQTVFPLAQWQSGPYQVFAVFDVREGFVFRVFLEDVLVTKTIHIDPSSANLPRITKASVTQKEAYERVCEGLCRMKLKIEDGMPNLLILKIHGSFRGGAPAQGAFLASEGTSIAVDAAMHEPLSELRTTRALALRLRKLEATDPLFAPLKDQARDCIRNFRAKAVVTSGDIAELAQLAIVPDGDVIREVLESLLDRLNRNVLFDPMLLRGLTTAIEYADPEHIRSDDLVSILKYLKERLEKLPTTDKSRLVKELSALAALLDAMVLAKVDDIDAKGIHEELRGYLSKFVRSDSAQLASESKDFELSALAKSSIQALKRIPTDESAMHKYFHRLLYIGEGVSLLAQAWGDKSLSSAAEGLKELYQGVKIGTRKKEWYETLQFLKLLVRQGAYAEVQKALAEEVKKEKGALHFIWSGDHGKEFFYLLAQQVYALPDRERTLALQEVKGLPKLGASVVRLEAASRSALSRASVRPEWRLQIYKEAQMRPSEEAELYTPPKGSIDPVGFTNAQDLAAQARHFLDSSNPQKVFLLQGRSGSGKSLFLENFSKEFWENCHSLRDPIPVLIRLAGIDPKDPKFIEHYLRDQVGIPEAELSKLKAEGRFVFLLDGYDEMPGQPLVNLYESANLKEWNCKVFIGCRTQHLARISNPDHYFAPLEGERLQQNLLEKVYVVPFAQDQMEDFLEKHARARPTPDWDAQRFLQTIKDIPGLFEMTQSPFILGMAASALPKLMEGESDARTLKVTRTKLYDSFVEQWFERQRDKLPGSLKSQLGPKEESLGLVFEFCEQLAAKMAEKNCHAAVYSAHRSLFSGDEASEWDIFFKKSHDDLLLKCAPIRATSIGFAFVHRSVLDHFVVRAGKKSVQGKGLGNTHSAPQKHWDLVHRESAEPYTAFDIDSTQNLVERFNQDLKPYERGVLKELALGVISAFKLPANRATIQELVFLAGSKDPDIVRGVLEALIGPIKTGTTVSLPLMEGLATALSRLQLDIAQVQGAQENIKTNLLICLGVICTKLGNLHQSGSDHSLFNELNVLGRLVDALLDAGVVAEGPKIRGWIDLLGGVSSEHSQIAAQAEYIKEGMRRLETDESRLGMFLKRTGHVAGGISSIIEGVNSYSPLKVYAGLKEFREGVKTKGFKHSWYEEVRLATLFVGSPSEKAGENIEAFRAWREEACREKEVGFKDKLFKKGATKEGTFRDEAAFALMFALDTQIQKRQSDEMRSAWIAELRDLAAGASEPVVHGVQRLIGIYTGYDDLGELSKEAIEEAKGALQPSAASGISGSAGFELFAYSLHPLQVMSALLSTAKQSSSWLLARLGVEAMNDPTVLEERSSHVSLHLAPKKGDPGKPLEEVFEAFFADKSQWVLLLLGDSGSGKSLSTKLQAAGQWAMRHESARDDKPIPLFISLTGVERTSTTIVEDHLKELGFTEIQVQELKSREFVFYLDGYDEMRGDETTNIITRNPFVGLENRLGWRGKVIVSCRTQYAEQRGNYEHYKQWFEPKEGDELFQKVTTVPFAERQIDKYLEQFSSHVENWTKADYLRYINTIPGVRAMIKTPFMLRLLAEVLPSIVADRGQEDEGAFELTRSDCYSAFLDLWFHRQLDKLIRGGHGDLSTTEVIGYREFAEQLAKGMGQESEVSYTPVSGSRVQSRFSAKASKEEDLNSYPARFLSNECLPIVIRARTACPLRVWRSGDAIFYSFIHDSLRDFLGSRQAFEKAPLDAAGLAELMEHKIQEAKGRRPSLITNRAETAAIDVEGIKSDFGKRLITKEIERIKFYTDDVHQDPEFKERLFTIIELSKTDKELSIAAANAITVLVAANEPLCEKDFRGISIPGAVIDGGNFSHSQFDGADLTNVSMQGVSIGGASFQECTMSGVNFGELPTLDGHKGAVNHLLAFADGTRLASSSDDKTVRVWDIATGQMQSCLEGHSASQGPLALVGENKIAAGGSDGQVRVWDIGSEKLLRTLCGRMQTETGKCIAVRTVGIGYNEETGALISGGDDDPRIDVRGLGGNLTFPKIAEDRTTALLVDKEHWIQGSQKGDIHILDPKTGDKEKTLSGHTQEVTTLALSPGKEHLISGSVDKTIRAWNVAEATSFKTFEGHGAVITGLSFTRLGQEFASISFDKTARIWELMKGVCLRTITLSSEGLDVAYLQGDQILATAGLKGKISLWKLDTQPLVFAPEEHSGVITAVSMNQSRTELATGSEDTSVRLWELERGTLRRVLKGHSAKVTTLSYAPDGSRLVSGSVDRIVIVWDAIRGLLIFRLDHALFPIEKVSYLSGGRKLVARGSDKVVHVWEASSGFYLRGKSASLGGDSNKVAGIALDGRSWYQVRTHGFLIELLEQLQELCLNSGDEARSEKAEAMMKQLGVRESKIKRKKAASVRTAHQPRAIKETGHRGGIQTPQERVTQLLSGGIYWTELLFKGYKWLDSGEKELATEALKRAVQMQVALFSYKGKCDGAEITVVKLIKKGELEIAERVFKGINQTFVWEPGQVKSVLEAGVEVNKDWVKGFCVSEALQGAIGMIKDAKDRSNALVEIGKAQVEVKEILGAKETFLQAQEIARGIRDNRDRCSALAEIAKAQARLGDMSGAKESIAQAKDTALGIEYPESPSRALVEIAQAQAQVGDVSGVQEILAQAQEAAKREVSAFPSTALVYIAQAQAQVGDVLGAQETVQGIESAHLRSWALVEIAKAQVQVGDVLGAQETAQGIESACSQSETLVEIAKAQAQVGDVSGVEETLARAQEVARGIESAKDRSKALVEIAKAQAQVGDVSGVEETLARAQEVARGIESAKDRSRALVEIAKAQAQVGGVSGVEETLARAQEVARGIESVYDRSRALVEIAKAKAQVGDVSRARETVLGISSDYNRCRALVEIAKAQAQVGDVSGVQETLGRAQEVSKRTEDAHSRHSALVEIVKVQVGLGDVSGAREMVWETEGISYKSAALVEIAKVQVELGDVLGARDTVLGISNGYGRCSALVEIAKVQVELGDVSAAKETIVEAEKKVGRIWSAKEQSWALVEIAKVQVEAGDVCGAQETLVRAQEVVQGIENTVSQSSALVKIVRVQVGLGDVSAAKETIVEAQRKVRGIEDTFSRSLALVEIVRVQLEVGDVSGARETVLGISNVYNRWHTLVEIAKAQAQAGDVSGAQEVARGIESAEDRSRALAEIARVQAQAGDVFGAQEAAKGIESVSGRSRALVEIVRVQVELGDISGAQETAKEIEFASDRSLALVEIVRMESVYDRSRALAEIAKAQVQVGDFASLRDSMQEFDLKALISFSNNFARAKGLDVSAMPFPLFSRIFQNISEFHPSANFFHEVFSLRPSISVSQFQEVLRGAVHKWKSLFKSGDTFTALFSGLGVDELLMFQEHIQSTYQALSEKSDLSSIFYVMGWVAAYGACIRKKIAEKEFEGILPLLGKLPDPFVRSRLVLELTKAQLGEGRWLEAIQNTMFALDPKAVLELVSQSTSVDQAKATQLAKQCADKPEIICELARLKGKTSQAKHILVEAFTKACSKPEPDIQAVWALRAYIETLQELNLHKKGLKQMRQAVARKIQALSSSEERRIALQGFSEKEQSALGSAGELGVALTQENASFESKLQAARLFAANREKRLFTAVVDNLLGVCESKVTAIQEGPIKPEPMLKVRSGRVLVAGAADFSGAQGLTEEQNGLLRSKGALFESSASKYDPSAYLDAVTEEACGGSLHEDVTVLEGNGVRQRPPVSEWKTADWARQGSFGSGESKGQREDIASPERKKSWRCSIL